VGTHTWLRCTWRGRQPRRSHLPAPAGQRQQQARTRAQCRSRPQPSARGAPVRAGFGAVQRRTGAWGAELLLPPAAAASRAGAGAPDGARRAGSAAARGERRSRESRWPAGRWMPRRGRTRAAAAARAPPLAMATAAATPAACCAVGGGEPPQPGSWGPLLRSCCSKGPAARGGVVGSMGTRALSRVAWRVEASAAPGGPRAVGAGRCPSRPTGEGSGASAGASEEARCRLVSDPRGRGRAGARVALGMRRGASGGAPGGSLGLVAVGQSSSAARPAEHAAASLRGAPEPSPSPTGLFSQLRRSPRSSMARRRSSVRMSPIRGPLNTAPLPRRAWEGPQGRAAGTRPTLRARGRGGAAGSSGGARVLSSRGGLVSPGLWRRGLLPAGPSGAQPQPRVLPERGAPDRTLAAPAVRVIMSGTPDSLGRGAGGGPSRMDRAGTRRHARWPRPRGQRRQQRGQQPGLWRQRRGGTQGARVWAQGAAGGPRQGRRATSESQDFQRPSAPGRARGGAAARTRGRRRRTRGSGCRWRGLRSPRIPFPFPAAALGHRGGRPSR